MLKKIGILIGCLFGVFIIAAFTLPFMIDVDKFRPQIVSAVNENINGTFELGKLQLSLWGGIKVKIDSLSLKGRGAAKPIVKTDSAYIQIPFLSLLMFHPTLTAILVAPEVEIIKQKNGKLNVMDLVQAAASPASASADKSTNKKPAADSAAPAAVSAAAIAAPTEIPAFVANASLGLRIEKGNFAYIDQQAGGKYLIDGVELNVQNLGLKDTIRVDMELPVKGTSPTINLDGLVTAKARITPIMVGSSVRSASGMLDLDATKLAFDMNKGMVQKSAKMPLKFSMDFDGSENDLLLKNLDIKFHELALNAKGVVTLAPTQAVKLNIHSSSFHLNDLEDIVPMLKEYKLGGDVTLEVNADGPLDKLGVRGNLNVANGKAAYPAMLKGPIAFDLKSAFTENSFSLSGLNATGPGSDLGLKGNAQNFKAPQFNFALSGKQVDIDQLLKLDANANAKKHAFLLLQLIENAEAAKPKALAAVKAGSPLASLVSNPMAAGAAGSFTANLNRLVAYGTPITDVAAKITLKNLVVNVESASLKTFDGIVEAKAAADLRTAGLAYSTSGTVRGISAKNALTTYLPKFKDTLEGKLNADWNIKGAAYPETARLRSLAGTANVNARDGRLRSVDMQESIKGVMAKVPFLKDKAPPKLDEGFESMRADLKFSGGIIDANPVEIVGSSRGLTIKGKSRITEDMIQDTYIDVYDPHQLLPKEISNGKDVALALHVVGSLSSPQTDYGYTVSHLAKNVVKNQGQALLKNGLQKMLGGKSDGGGSAGGQKTGDAVKDALKKIKIF